MSSCRRRVWKEYRSVPYDPRSTEIDSASALPASWLQKVENQMSK